MNVPWSDETAASIGVDWLLAAIAPVGDFGRRTRAAERTFRPGDEAACREALHGIVSLAREVPQTELAAIAAAIAAAPDPSAAFSRAAAGGILDDLDLFEVSRFLDALAELAGLASHPLLAAAAPRADVSALRAILAPGRSNERTFYLADAFSSALAAARGASAAAQARYDVLRSHLAERVARYAGLEHVRDGEFTLMRERGAAPLPPEVRVVRETQTYYLCELALDAAGLAALAERDAAAQLVADAEEDVRAQLSARIALAASVLAGACSAIGELDVLVARTRFAGRFACVLPELSQAASVTFEDGRYLPLLAVLGERERPYAPVSLELAGVGIVTGPNMGGKTAALRTLGFIVACVALGLPVPATRATIPLVEDIAWLGLGTLPEDDALLSAFGAEVVALRTFLERAPARALVLIDEFARTTSPREGRALLVALVEKLRAIGAFGLAATHFSGVATSANAPHYTVGGLRDVPRSSEPLELRAALDAIAFSTDYRLARVDEADAPRTDALALAGALGLDPALIARARAEL